MTDPTAPQTAVDAALRAVFIDEWYALLGEVDDAIVRGGWRIDEVGTEEVFDKHRDAIERSLAAIRAESSAETEVPLPDESWCDCDSAPIYGIRADRHLPSCRYGIVMDYLDIRDPRALAPADAAGGREEENHG